MTADVRASATRATSTDEGRVTLHSFSFGPHYDPGNLGFGPLVCHNDDLVDAGAGYAEHPHTGLEIVTWVLEGALLHHDSTGSSHVVEAGRAQVLSAGSGIRHSEVADPASGRCRFVQAWLAPTTPGGPPTYTRGEAPPVGSGLVEVAGGDGLPIGTAGARLLLARLGPGDAVTLPDDAAQHVFAASGAVSLGDLDLHAGDAVRLTDEPGHVVTATRDTELLVWSFAG
ncbi:quercetin 2,3-dioxygenase [Nocardioides flavus (ex Wang et al. 2016)]|uniref:Quercetin 2,3-dioxygenase n=1 Tax=Nocardioides flavus (ex Wang et al. 2016) TaxID=2058780 RepID=A0ABQ3HGD9_9ACTN|nr:pirin family protein [Nocardioides flavus (ex Wang et al. 2016)]GHE15588.1 quercetin 2,3-dioxygenase [Nocardioides flavus (ex Wang et al. 2016)]